MNVDLNKKDTEELKECTDKYTHKLFFGAVPYKTTETNVTFLNDGLKLSQSTHTFKRNPVVSTIAYKDITGTKIENK